jgi:hypothetical protein
VGEYNKISPMIHFETVKIMYFVFAVALFFGFLYRIIGWFRGK